MKTIQVNPISQLRGNLIFFISNDKQSSIFKVRHCS